MNNIIRMFWVIGLLAVVVLMLISFIAAIGSLKSTNGCFNRYHFDDKGKPVDVITTKITLKANGNYDNPTPTDPNPAYFGKWLNTNVIPQDKQTVKVKITGQLSLCRAYIPINNLQSITNTDKNKQLIPIPRVEEYNFFPVSLYFDATIDEWRNIATILTGDKVVISISPESKDKKDQTGKIIPATNTVFTDIFTKNKIVADCSEGKTTYSPICGKYSSYKGQYVTSCVLFGLTDFYLVPLLNIAYLKPGVLPSSCADFTLAHPIHLNIEEITLNKYLETMPRYFNNMDYVCYQQKKFYKMPAKSVVTSDCSSLGSEVNVSMAVRISNDNKKNLIFCIDKDSSSYNDSKFFWTDVYGSLPEVYHDDGRYTFAWSDNLDNLLPIYNKQCNTGPPNYDTKDKDYILSPQYEKDKRFWFSANDSSGLLYRFDTSVNPTNPKQRGADYKFAQIQKDQTLYKDPNYLIIYNEEYTTGPSPTYMQFRFHQNDGQFTNNTGGYILNIKQTSCRSVNGRDLGNSVSTRGKVEYIYVPSDEDPNNSGKQYKSYFVDVNDKGEANVEINEQDINMQIWMRINNDPQSYADSTGEYEVDISTISPFNTFNGIIMQPLLTLFKINGKNIGTLIFQNMTCYTTQSSPDSCINFFNYVKGMLTLSVMVYFAMFMLGMSQIEQKTLVINILKILIVGGLINQSTFAFFNDYIIDSIITFSDTIIANISGYSIFQDPNIKVTNPFMFLDAIMTNILFNGVFVMQVSALLSLGISGVLYFIIVVIAIFIMLVSAMRAIAIYIMAFLAICVLIAVAPIFLTFMLFNTTRYLFDNWIKMTVKYMFEPLILMVGFIILTQLFTIYLDFVIGYSVCWKCTLAFQIPFPHIGGFNPALLNMPIFCFNWFAPWGYDHQTGMMGINLANIAALVIIAYCIYGYIELSSKMVSKLVGGIGPSATSMGAAMSSSFENSMLSPIGMDKASRDNMFASSSNRAQANRDAEIDLDKEEKPTKN